MYICVLLKIDVFPDPFLYKFKFGIYIIYIYFIVINKDIMHCQIITILHCQSHLRPFFKSVILCKIFLPECMLLDADCFIMHFIS